MSRCTYTSSGLKAADAAIVTRPCLLHSLVLIPAAADSSIIVYDNAGAASGLAVAKLTALANTASVSHNLGEGVECLNGLYVDVSGSAAGYIVYYSLL